MPVPISVTGWTGGHAGTQFGADEVCPEIAPTGSHWAKWAASSAPAPQPARQAPPAPATPVGRPQVSAEEAALAASEAAPHAFAGADVVAVKNLTFTYPGTDGQPLPGVDPMISDMSFDLGRGDLCLLIGANGAGKTTLLKLLAGRHMVERDMVRVLGRSAFHDTELSRTGECSYLGGQWRRDVAFAGYDVPLAGDFPARRMLDSVRGVSAARRQRVVDVLDVNLEWRMHQVSDGQRRRVQLAMGLLRPFQVLLLDEITVDLDVLVRRDLMNFLKQECEERGATIIYATHIFDGLDEWATHLMYVARGHMQIFDKCEGVEGLKEVGLRRTVEKWLREEKVICEKLAAEGKLHNPSKAKQGYDRNNGWAAGRLATTIKLSSNAVLRG